MESQAIEARDRVGSGARPPDARAGLRHFGQKTQSQLGPRPANRCRAAALYLSREQRCHVRRFSRRHRLSAVRPRSPCFLERGSSPPRSRSRVGGTEVTEASPLLSLRLSVDYRNKPGVLRDVSLEIQSGEILGLVGQSGSGKSTLSLAILRLLHLKGGIARGDLLFKGEDLFAKTEAQMRSLRGREISIVLQSPLSSLNPALRIGSQLSEAWRAHATGTQSVCSVAISNALSSVSLPNDADFLRRLPGQLSVGQAQRVIIAMAILHRPSLLIADEATSALDTITQSEILGLFAQLNRELGMGILYISHDLLSVAALCHRIAILNAGEIVECGPPSQIFGAPRHAYTQKLVAALPRLPVFTSPASPTFARHAEPVLSRT